MDAHRITELVDRLARLISNASLAEGLKPAQWEALRFLSRANRFSNTPGTLALWLGSTKGTVSQTINSLVSRDLLEKVPANDRRSVHLMLSPKGVALLELDRLHEIRKVVAEIDVGEREQLGTRLGELLERLIAANRGKPFGTCKDCRHFSPRSKETLDHFCGLLKEQLTEHDSNQICVEQEAA